MHMRLMIRLVLLLVIGATLGGMPRVEQAKASLPPAQYSVYPEAGPPGTIFFFAASSFESERVGYWFNSPDGRVYSNKYRYAAYAYQSTIQWRWQVPYDAVPGHWTAVAQGEESGFQQVIPFQILPSTGMVSVEPAAYVPTNAERVDVLPAAGPAGTNFTFTAPGLEGERVGYWFDQPNGQILADNQRYWFEAESDPATWQWKAPANAIPGVWKVTVQGEETGITHTIFFEIREGDARLPQTVPVNPPCLGAVEPFVGYPNTDFKFFVTGFPPRTHVQYWAEDPNGRKYDYDDGLFIGSNPDGRVDITWNAPEEATYGYWKMVFLSGEVGKNPSRIERVLYFEIRNPAEPILQEEAYVPPPPCQWQP